MSSKPEILPLEHTIKNTYSFSVKPYDNGRFVYLEVSQDHYQVKLSMDEDSREELKAIRLFRDSKWAFCLSGRDYQQMVGLYGRNGNWIVDFWQEDKGGIKELVAVSPEQMDFYLRDEPTYPYHQDLPVLDVKTALDTGRFDLIVQKTDSVWLREDGMPIIRHLKFDYISSGFNRAEYRIDELVAHLKENPQIKALKKVKIPSYNAHCRNDCGIEFAYAPADMDEFKKLFSIASFERMGLLREKLGADQFKRAKTLPREDDDD
jgi:hypothetical protein